MNVICTYLRALSMYIAKRCGKWINYKKMRNVNTQFAHLLAVVNQREWLTGPIAICWRLGGTEPVSSACTMR